MGHKVTWKNSCHSWELNWQSFQSRLEEIDNLTTQSESATKAFTYVAPSVLCIATLNFWLFWNATDIILEPNCIKRIDSYGVGWTTEQIELISRLQQYIPTRKFRCFQPISRLHFTIYIHTDKLWINTHRIYFKGHHNTIFTVMSLLTYFYSSLTFSKCGFCGASCHM